MPTLALIAHDKKKSETAAFCQRHRAQLARLKLVSGTPAQSDRIQV
jgi:methylglyoxal synthase